MDILLPYGLILFGVTGVISLIFALLTSALGFGAASEIWGLARICGYLFLINLSVYCFYRVHETGRPGRALRTARKRKRRR